MFTRVHLLRKGEGIRREHILEALVAMLADANWGIPQTLFLDNGGEFNIDLGVESIAALGLPDRTRIRRARPYNPQSKGQLEAVFNALKHLFKGYVGYIGGNRFRMPTQQLGQKPKPFPGDFDLFQVAFDQTLEFYHKRKPTTGQPPPFERFGRSSTSTVGDRRRSSSSTAASALPIGRCAPFAPAACLRSAVFPIAAMPS